MNIQLVDVTKMLIGYRYISLVVTSLFYIIGVDQHTISQRLIVITGMAITSLVMNYLYVHNQGDKQKMVLLIIIETIGNCIILIPSGGLQSPYIWYILSSIILSGIELGRIYLWVNAGIYLVNMIGVSYWMSIGQPISEQIRLDSFNLVAGFVLVTFIIEQLINYAKLLEEKKKQSEHYLDYTMKIYETVYLFTSQGDKESLIQMILQHIGEELKTPGVLFVEIEERYQVHKTYARGLNADTINYLIKQVDREYIAGRGHTDKIEVLKYNNGFIGIPIRHTYSIFGILIVSDTMNQEELKFIGYVSGMIFKKIELERMNQGLVLSEEQNRIANEIHDSVLQKLFGVSCRLFTTTKRIDTLERDHLKKDLDDMRGHITQAMTELRSTIYGLSWNKSGKNDFLDKLEQYIETMKNLHGTAITLEIEGNIELLQLQEQKALYRVCCEGVANGIKHGKATYIDILIKSGVQAIDVVIKDNGKGFNYDRIIEEGKLGLGIKNMEQLIQQLNGVLRIKSDIGQGTSLDIHIQHSMDTLQKNRCEKGIV